MDSLPLPFVSCLYRPNAPTRSANAAVGELIAVGSTSPGFCGASNSAFTRSQPATAIVAVTPTATIHHVPLVSVFTEGCLRSSSILEVEPEGDVRRRWARVEVVRHFIAAHAEVLLGIHTGETGPCVDVP